MVATLRFPEVLKAIPACLWTTTRCTHEKPGNPCEPRACLKLGQAVISRPLLLFQKFGFAAAHVHCKKSEIGDNG